MFLYLTLIALRAILRAWILGVPVPTRKPEKSLREALSLPSEIATPTGEVGQQDASLELSDGPYGPSRLTRREIPTPDDGRLEWLSEGYQISTNFLGLPLDTARLSVLEYGILPKRTYRIFRKCRIYDHIVRFIIISLIYPKYHHLTDISYQQEKSDISDILFPCFECFES